MSPDRFREQVDAEWEHLKNGPTTLTREEVDRVCACFVPPPYVVLGNEEALLAEQRLRSPAFSRWIANNVFAHQRRGYAPVTLSTKVTGVPPGDVTDIQMDAVADWSERFGFGEIRISHEQNFVLPDVEQRKLFHLWKLADVEQFRH